VKRDLKNVQQALRILEEYSLIRMTPARRSGNRRVRIPEAPFDEISLRIAI
jgi:predicted transcriptional regulator